MKSRKLLWFIVTIILMLFCFLVLYLRHKLGKLDCEHKGGLSFQRYLLMLKQLFVAPDNNSVLCGRDIKDVCWHIATKQFPQDVKYYLVDYWSSDSEFQEFVFRILMVVALVALIIFCNFCKWMTSNELHYEEDYEEKTIQSNLSRAKLAKNTKIQNNFLARREKDITAAQEPKSARCDAGCKSWSWWKFIGVLFAVFTLISIPWEFVRLYQKEVSKRAARATIGSPPECFPNGMSVLQSLQSWLRHHLSWDHREDPCEKYYYTLLVDPLWELTPLMVLSSAMTRCILHPIEQLFSGLGRSCRMFFSEIPAQWQPIIMALLIILTLVVLLMVFRYRISIPLLFKIEPKTPVQDSDKESSRKQPLSSLHHHGNHSDRKQPLSSLHHHSHGDHGCNHDHSERPILIKRNKGLLGRRLRLDMQSHAWKDNDDDYY